MAGYVVNTPPGISGDTVSLVHGAHTIYSCLSHGITTGCDRHAELAPAGTTTLKVNGTVIGAVAQFPLFQYIPAVIFTRLGMSDTSVYKGLGVISLLAFIGVVALCGWTVSRTGRRWAPPVTVLILTTSPLIYYAWVTFGESLAAFLFVLLAVAALRRWPPIVLALSAFLATITKETVFPFVVLLGAAALWATPIAMRPLRRAHWVSLGVGVVAGVLASAAFNEFRYHQLMNYLYGQSALTVPGVGRRLGFSVALWVAPNGGVALFWSLFTAVTLGVVTIFILSLRRKPRSARQALPAGALVLALLLLTGELASWFAPFGWIAWGPRLILPPLPAILLITVVIYGEEVGWVVRRALATPARTGLIAAAVVAVGMPQVNVLHANAVVGGLFGPDQTCPVGANIFTNASYYYHCIDHWAWGRHMILLDSFKAFDNVGGMLFGIGFGAAWICLIFSAAPPWPRAKPREVEAAVAGSPS